MSEMLTRLYYSEKDSGGKETPEPETFVPDLNGGLTWESPFDDNGKTADDPDFDPGENK